VTELIKGEGRTEASFSRTGQESEDMAPSAEVMSDLKPKALDFHDWRYHNGESKMRPILIKVGEAGKSSSSFREVSPHDAKVKQRSSRIPCWACPR